MYYRKIAVISLCLLCLGLYLLSYVSYSHTSTSYSLPRNEIISSVLDEYPTSNKFVRPVGRTGGWIPYENISIKHSNVTTWEVTRHPNEELNQSHIDKAWKLYNETYNHAQKRNWFSFKSGKKDGYAVKGNGEHYPNVKNKSILQKANNLNPKAPRNLIYYQHPKEDTKILAGVMFEKGLGSNESGRQVGGPGTVWHFHPQKVEKYHLLLKGLLKKETLNISRNNLFKYQPWNKSLSAYKEERVRTPEMLHVWFVPHPDGPFGTGMSVPEENLVDNQKYTKEEFSKQLRVKS